MVDVLAAAVSAKKISVNYATPDSQRRTSAPEIEVIADVSVVIASGETYERDTGIPLTNLFTTANASDVGLDVNQPITMMNGLGFCVRRLPTTRSATRARSKHGGLRSSLILFNAPANAAAIALNEVGDDADLTALTVAFGAATTAVARLVLRGTLRPGVSIEDLGGQKQRRDDGCQDFNPGASAEEFANGLNGLVSGDAAVAAAGHQHDAMLDEGAMPTAPTPAPQMVRDPATGDSVPQAPAAEPVAPVVRDSSRSGDGEDR